LLTPDQEHQGTASSAEFVEVIHDDRNVLKRIAMCDESFISCTTQKQNVRVELGSVQTNRNSE
jgi:hypothetical protein